MKVEFINKSFDNNYKKSPCNSFGNGYGNLSAKIDSYMPKGIKGIKRLSNNLGEVQNIIINAIGTGIIAPIFVRYNFLSKTDTDTRKYSAMREPISAILAIATQVSAIIPFNKVLNKGFNIGALGDDYNKTAFQDADFIRSDLKKRYPDKSIPEINRMASEIERQQSEKLERDLYEKNTVEITRRNSSEPINLDKHFIYNAVNTSVDDIIADEQAEINRLMTTKRESRIKRREFYRLHNEETIRYIDEIDKILENKDLTAVRRELKAKSASLRHQPEMRELRLITKELLGHARGNIPKSEEERFIWVLQRKSAKIRRVAKAYAPEFMPDREAVIKAIDTELEQRKSQIDNVLSFLNKIKEEIKNGKSIKEIHEMFDIESLTNERLAKRKVNFTQSVADTLKTQINGNAKGLKQMGGLILGLMILPFTCYLLNKVYPVIMDKMFPKMSQAKKGENLDQKESETVKNG